MSQSRELAWKSFQQRYLVSSHVALGILRRKNRTHLRVRSFVPWLLILAKKTAAPRLQTDFFPKHQIHVNAFKIHNQDFNSIPSLWNKRLYFTTPLRWPSKYTDDLNLSRMKSLFTLVLHWNIACSPQLLATQSCLPIKCWKHNRILTAIVGETEFEWIFMM